ncbi:hypothetical protein DVR12_07485 [Chitinophaga silvatica]|uniref:Uncharacterized protein n=1 Tax=Chitinophaga silvatica TaxID=2282649 RepID=A0A3E1YEW1_9BACT|nr:hypothetical protein [Chitinophaga silvatica]RFS25019.1 hypothetical protein DVR12_07485 [Chitinophaga silvatica]
MDNLFDLKTKLFEAHRQDSKQTVYALLLVEFFSLSIFLLVSYGVFEGRHRNMPLSIFWMLLILPAGTTIPFLFRFIQILHRTNKILDLVEAIESGEIVTRISTFTDYKIFLQLRIFDIRFYSIEYVEILLESNHSLFRLPISIENVKPLRSLLSRPITRRYGIGGTTSHWSAN